MKAIELDKHYNPSSFEKKIYEKWLKEGFFKLEKDNENYFTIVMPPPNVTGILHLGHALNNSIPDVLIRYKKMMGFNTLWLPGTDHAGIATQHVVEKIIAKEGLKKEDLGREKFLERTWQVKDKHHDIIVSQLKEMGSACDWSRERFTLDEGLSDAVKKSFINLYKKGLIYRGEYLVNYCPSCQTALSDDEVEHKSIKGNLYDIKYPYDGGFITVATTRPETMFGDVAVAIHPKDKRYRNLVGKLISLPLTDKKIPIIEDEYVDMSYGTGMVKITPAHDPNDYKIGKAHKLESVNVLTKDGKLNENVPAKYRGLSIKDARKAVLADLEEQGLLINTTPLSHEVGHCYRCSTVIEPYLSKQWFVKMREMADKALLAYKNKRINIIPARWEKTYTNWLDNIRDWCISRQLWWGHRIPVYYCGECNKEFASEEELKECPSCKSKKIYQDEDVLDTWFSSWLWPFSLLGWPEKSEDLKKLFPTSVLITGYDIIFFWVSRMIMASLEFLDEVPFKDVYLTGLTRDKQNRKMSKSLGNGIDPLKIIKEYGSDAMKLTLVYLNNQGQDMQIDENDFKIGSRFANKIWNATRFLLLNLEDRELIEVDKIQKREVDLWIYDRLNECTKSVMRNLDNYKFSEAISDIQSFFWDEFCDWYIEIVKDDLKEATDDIKNQRISLLMDLLKRSMILMHPFLPFVTEEIYGKLPNTKGSVLLRKYNEILVDIKVETSNFNIFQSIIKSVRMQKAELGISDKKIDLIINLDKDNSFIKDNVKYIKSFAGLNNISFNHKNVSSMLPITSTDFNLYLDVGSALDVNKEIEKLKGIKDKAERDLKGTLAKLNNKQFMDNAKEVAIEKEKSKEKEFKDIINKSLANIKILEKIK